MQTQLKQMLEEVVDHGGAIRTDVIDMLELINTTLGTGSMTEYRAATGLITDVFNKLLAETAIRADDVGVVRVGSFDDICTLAKHNHDDINGTAETNYSAVRHQAVESTLVTLICRVADMVIPQVTADSAYDDFIRMFGHVMSDGVMVRELNRQDLVDKGITLYVVPEVKYAVHTNDASSEGDILLACFAGEQLVVPGVSDIATIDFITPSGYRTCAISVDANNVIRYKG